MLSDLLKNTNVKVRRKAIACLGELIFYIATQQQSEGTTKKQEDLWQVPTSIIAAVVRCLRQSEDEIVQAYATKAIENVS